jgi:hypothetical protein
MNFGEVLELWVHKESIPVCRKGWNGKNMYIMPQFPDKNSKMTLPYIYMKTVQNDLVPWVASHTDLFATDWEITQ